MNGIILEASQVDWQLRRSLRQRPLSVPRPSAAGRSKSFAVTMPTITLSNAAVGQPTSNNPCHNRPPPASAHVHALRARADWGKLLENIRAIRNRINWDAEYCQYQNSDQISKITNPANMPRLPNDHRTTIEAQIERKHVRMDGIGFRPTRRTSRDGPEFSQIWDYIRQSEGTKRAPQRRLITADDRNTGIHLEIRQTFKCTIRAT